MYANLTPFCPSLDVLTLWEAVEIVKTFENLDPIEENNWDLCDISKNSEFSMKHLKRKKYSAFRY